VRFLLLLLLLLVLHPATEAAVGLVTVPERQGVRLTIYNGVDLTLVQETRTLVLRQGRNRIQYQWAGTLIDTTSLELRPLERQDDIEIIDALSPPHAPATLVWEIESKIEGAVRFEISYFTSGVAWTADYTMRADRDEATAMVEGWVGVDNRSGESYAHADIRLVVGTITLIERIRDLASGQVEERSKQLDRRAILRHGRDLLGKRAADKDGEADGVAMERTRKLAFDELEQAAEVVSARLADYHLFIIGGEQDLPDQATTRFLAIQTRQPMVLEVLYRVELAEQAQAIKLYRFVNDAEHKRPDGPLPDGPWHVFRVADPATSELSYQGLAAHEYTPPGQKVELELGVDPGVSVAQVHEQHCETDQHFDRRGHLDGWIAHDRWMLTMVDTRAFPLSLEYLIQAQGSWEVTNLTGERRDQYTWRHQDRLAAGDRLVLGPFTISTRMGVLAAADGLAKAVHLPVPLPLPAISPAH